MSSFLNQIRLIDYRNYTDTGFQFHKNAIFILGNNGKGKSNLLEAIQTISFGANLRSEHEKNKIKHSADLFQINAKYTLLSRDFLYTYRGGNRSHRSLNLNGVQVKSIREIKSNLLKTISFKAKDSIDLIRGAPSLRRDWLDILIALFDIEYIDHLRRYTKALEQKNTLLKSIIHTNQTQIDLELDIWDMELAKSASYLMKTRDKFIQNLVPIYQRYFQHFLGEGDGLVSYTPNIEINWSQDILTQIIESLQKNRHLDKRRGLSTIGPQKDDINITLNEYPARHFASQGQQRVCALSLHLSQLEVWRDFLGYSPILLLDDVCAELDTVRQNLLFQSLPKDTQIFITTTHLNNLPLLSSEYQIIQL